MDDRDFLLRELHRFVKENGRNPGITIYVIIMVIRQIRHTQEFLVVLKML